MNEKENLNIYQLLAYHDKENKIIIPGFDIIRTIICLIFSLFLLIIISNGVLFKNEIKELSTYQRISTIIILFILGLSILSGLNAIIFFNYPVNKIKKASSIFYSKVLINLAILLFFATICFWVILLGGILYSPFATLLSISPILLLIHISRDIEFDENKIFTFLKAYIPVMESEKELKRWNMMKNISKIFNIIALSIVLITIFIGWIKFNVFGEKFAEICKSDWYIKLYYSIYYLSVLIAIMGIIPKRYTQKLTEKIY